jgi:peroxiredoxin
MLRSLRYSALTVAVLLAACSGSASSASSSAPPTIAKQGLAAPAWSLPSDTGARLTSASFKGKGVYLNFFATWCPPCNAEAPDIDVLYRKYAKSGLVVIGVDEQENADKAKLFRNEHQLTYPIVVDDSDVLRNAYAVNGLPVHVFIGRDGVVKQMVTGEMDKGEIETAIRAITK